MRGLALLAYPLLHAELPAPDEELLASLVGLPDALTFPPEQTRAFNLNYAGDEAVLADPAAFPASHDLRGLPPFAIVAAVSSDFLYAVATAGHQNEGGNTTSDTWFLEHVTPTVFREPSGVPCDGGNRWPADLDLAAAMSLNAHRFSSSGRTWSPRTAASIPRRSTITKRSSTAARDADSRGGQNPPWRPNAFPAAPKKWSERS
jgi:hypothetical protein